MTELQRLDDRTAALALRAVPAGARGFFGADPVTQNDALLARTLATAGAQVFRCGEAVLGFVPNPHQPRQATVAAAGADPATIAAFVDYLGVFHRFSSFVAMAGSDEPGARTLRDCGFSYTGTLAGHRLQSAAYHDVEVYFGTREELCRS